MYGKHHSAETKLKISKAKKGRSPGVNAGKFGGMNPHARRVAAYDADGNCVAVFDSIIEAAALSGMCRSGISAVLAGKQRLSGGYVWKYASD